MSTEHRPQDTSRRQDGSLHSMLPEIENWSKFIIGSIAFSYALGLLISNMHYGELGFADFGLLRPRYILVGIAFVIYAVLPFLVMVSPLIGFRLIPGLFRTRLRASAASIVIMVLCIEILPMPFWYFVPYVYRGAEMHLLFWTLYLFPLFLLSFLLFYLPGSLLAYSPVFKSLERWKALLKATMVVGAFTLPFPYSQWVFPNISQAVGGGQPRVATVIFKSPLPDIDDPLMATKLQTGGIMSALVWYEGENAYFLSSTASVMAKRHVIVAVATDEVRAFIFGHGYIHVHASVYDFDTFTTMTDIYYDNRVD